MNRSHWLALVGLAGLTLVTFHTVLLPPKPLVAQDAPLTSYAITKQTVAAGKRVVWNANGYLGTGGYEMRYNPLTLLTLITPTPLVNTVTFTLLTLLTGIACYGLCIALGVRPAAAFVGAGALMLSGHFITTVYSGHTGTFLMWPCYLAAAWLITVGIERRSPLACAWAGILAGLGAGQLDIAVIVALFLAAWVVFLVVTTRAQRRWAKLTIGLLLAAGCGLAYSLPVVQGLIGLSSRAGGVDSVADDTRTAEEKWNWATQWSLPLEETLTLIAPGYYGFGLEPASPYWGRIGQDANWPTQHVGFPRFSMSTQGVGILTVALALLAVGLAGSMPGRRHVIYFWAIVAVVALLFAWGRYCDVTPTAAHGFGPYRLFYHLPGMDQMRNPLKFLYPCMLALALLAAFGMDMLLQLAGHRRVSASKTHGK